MDEEVAASNFACRREIFVVCEIGAQEIKSARPSYVSVDESAR